MATARCYSISFLSSLPQCFTFLRLGLANCFRFNKKPPNEKIFREDFGEKENEPSSDSFSEVEIPILQINIVKKIYDPKKENSDDQINQGAITYISPVRQNSQVDDSIEIQSIHVQNAGDEEMSELAKSHMGELNKFILSGGSDASDKPKLLTPIRLVDPESETTPLKYTPIYDQNFLKGAHFPMPIQAMEEPLAIHHFIPRVLEIRRFDPSYQETESRLDPINNKPSTFPSIEDLECLSAGVSTENSYDSLSPRHTRSSSWGPDASPLIQPNFEHVIDPGMAESEPSQPDSHGIYSAFGSAYDNPRDPVNNGEVGRLGKPRPRESADMYNADGLGGRETQPQPQPKPMTEDEIRKIGRKSMDMREKADKGFFEMLSAESFNDFFGVMGKEQDPKSFFDKLSEYVGAISSRIIPSATPAPDKANLVSRGRDRR
jgi:hypothetical protein